MPALPTKSFTTIVTNIVTGIQGRAAKLINFTTGSTLLAISQGFTGILLWFQALVLQLLTACRLSTATDTDVDTFTADFMPIIAGSVTTALPSGSPRLGAQAATGSVTFARFTAAPTALFIPAASSVSAAGVVTNAGTLNAATVQTTDGSQNFVVLADTTNGNYSAITGGYTMPSNVASLIVAVIAQLPGAGGNVQAGAISIITSALTGIDTVTNVAAFTNGTNQESDTALKARFAAYILGLSRGDYYGLASALLGTAVTVQWTLTEGYNLDGSKHLGYFFVVADDGSGSPSTAFLTLISNAVQAVRPLGISASVFPPTIIFANVGMQLTTAAGYDHNTVVSVVAALIATNINSLGLGVTLPFTLLSAWAYSVPGVTQVSAVTLNGSSGDGASLSPTKATQDGFISIGYATVKAGVMTIS
jgi:Baseplate J-like protein